MSILAVPMALTMALTLTCNGYAEAQQRPSDEGAATCSTDCVAVGTWQLNVGLGLGVRTNPLLDGDDAPLLILPELAYYGERFFLKNFEMGVTLFEDSRHQINLLVTPSRDQMYFNRWDPLNFSDGGTLSSSAGYTAAPPISSTPYTVNIFSRSAEGGPAGAGSEDGASGGATAEPPPPVDSAEPLRLSGTGHISVRLNGETVAMEDVPERDGTFSFPGSDGYTITMSVSEGHIDIAGLAEGDSLIITSSGFIGAGDMTAGGEQTNTANITFVSGDDFDVALTSEEGLSPNSGSAGMAGDGESKRMGVHQVKHRKVAGLAGIEYAYSHPRFIFHFQGLTDFTQVHEGQEYRVATIFPWQWAQDRWAVTLGLNYQTRDVLDYYYGLEEAEVPDPDWVFSPTSAGVSKLVRLDWQKPLNRHWSLRGMAQYTRLANEIHPSPLVVSEGSGSVFIGAVYHF